MLPHKSKGTVATRGFLKEAGDNAFFYVIAGNNGKQRVNHQTEKRAGNQGRNIYFSKLNLSGVLSLELCMTT